MDYEKVEKPTAGEDNGVKAALLVSSGVLMGLGLRNKVVRRLAGLGCIALTAALAIPLAQEYLEKKREGGGGTLVDLRMDTGDDPEKDPVFQFKVEMGEEEPGTEAPKAPEGPADPAL